MNFDKALNLLIGIFIVVNLVLGMTNYNKYSNVYRLDDEQVETIVSLLEERGVSIRAELPMDYKPLEPVKLTPVEFGTDLRDDFIKAFLNEDLSKVLITKEVVAESEQIVYKYENKELRFIDNEVYYTDKDLVESTVSLNEKLLLSLSDAFVAKIPVEDVYKNVEIDYKIESYHGEVTYYELYNGFPLFNSYITMKVNAKGVYEAQMKLVRQDDFQQQEKSIYSINRVLFEFFGHSQTEHVNQQIEITAIELGYMIPDSARVHLLEEEAIPVYKIQVRDLELPLFVNAYTNKLVE